MSSRLRSSIALAGRSLRRLRSDGAASWVVIVLVALLAFGVVAAPRRYNSVSDGALEAGVEAATAPARNLLIEQARRLPPTGDRSPFSPVSFRGEALGERLPPALGGIVTDDAFVVDSPDFVVGRLPGDTGDPPARFLRFRYQEGVEDRVTLMAGEMPQAVGPAEVLFSEDESALLPVFQVAVTDVTSNQLQMPIGSRALLTARLDDPLNALIPARRLGYRLIVEVAGIFSIDEPDAEYWFEDQRLHQPFLGADPANPDAVIVSAMGLMAPDAYRDLLAATAPSLWNYGWRFFVDPASFDAGDIASLEDALFEFELGLGAGVFAALDEPRFSTGLPGIFDSFQRGLRLTIDFVSLVSVALGVLALVVLALLGALVANRRKEASRLARSRGASWRQLALARLLESLVLLVLAAVIGLWAALVLVDGRDAVDPVMLALATSIGVSLLLVVIAVPSLREGLAGGDELRDTRSRRRVVVEVLLLAVSFGGLVLFRRRGLDTRGIEGGSGFDPFLAFVPVLLGIALAVILLRLYPMVLRRARWVASMRPGLVGFVGVGRMERASPASRLPLGVAVLAVGVAGFSALVLDSIQSGRHAAAWQRVGADFALESFHEGEPLSPLADDLDLEGVEATADATLLVAGVGATGSSVSRVQLVAVDTTDYAAVASGTPVDPEFPDEMLLEEGGAVGFGLVDALVSDEWPLSTTPEVGDVVTARVAGDEVSLVVQAVGGSFPYVEPGGPFVVVSRAALAESLPSLDLRPTRRFVRAPAVATEEMLDAVAGQSLGTRVLSRSALLSELADAPLVEAVDHGYRVAIAASVALAAIAAFAGVALTAPERERDLGYLRTLGLSPGQVVALTFIEQVPTVLLATLFGLAFASGFVWLVRPAFDLSPFTGSVVGSVVITAWGAALVISAAVLGVILLATAFYSFSLRRADLGGVLRLGDHR